MFFIDPACGGRRGGKRELNSLSPVESLLCGKDLLLEIEGQSCGF